MIERIIRAQDRADQFAADLRVYAITLAEVLAWRIAARWRRHRVRR